MQLSLDAVRAMLRAGAHRGEKRGRGSWRVRLPRSSSTAEEPGPGGTLSTEEALGMTGVAPALLWAAVYEGGLPVVRCGDEFRFRAADLEAWLEGLRVPSRRRESRSVPVPLEAGEELLTVEQAADRLGVAPATLWRWLNDAELPFVLAPGRRGHRAVRHVRVADIDDLGAQRGIAPRRQAARRRRGGTA